jgi:hypothetical protein
MTDRTDQHPGDATAADVSAPIDLGASPLDLTADDDHGPVPRSRRRTIVLAGLAAAALAGAAVLGAAGVRIAGQKNAVLEPPAQVAGFQRDDSENARTTAEFLRNAIAAEAQLDQTVGVIWTNPSDADRSIMLFGGTALIWTPGRDLDTVFELLKDNAGEVTGIKDYPAGSLDGELKCGSTGAAGEEIGVCGWADHGSLALALFPGRAAADAAPLMVQVREATQKRG